MLRERSRTGRPCGSEEFIRRAERVTGRRLDLLSPGRPGILDTVTNKALHWCVWWA